jgi:malonyl-CoA O-methyltransferase
VRASFEKSVRSYDRAAALQREMADLLLARLGFWRATPARLLDLGCGTGTLTRELVQRLPQTTVVAADLAHGMARATRQRARRGWWSPRRARTVTANAMQLPFADGAFDVVLSNLMLQWCEPQRVFAEVRRVLRPGGLWLFTTFGPDTLQELRAAWRAADEGVHVHAFPDMHDLGDLLLAEGFVDPVVDVERVRHFLPSVREVLMNLKALGAHNLAPQRS